MDTRQCAAHHRVVRPLRQQPGPDFQGTGSIAGPGTGFGQTVLPVSSRRFQVDGKTVFLRRFSPSLLIGKQARQRAPRFAAGRIHPYGSPKAVFGSVADARIPQSITRDQGRFGNVREVFQPCAGIGVDQDRSFRNGRLVHRLSDMLYPPRLVNWEFLSPLFIRSFEVFESLRNYPLYGSSLHTG